MSRVRVPDGALNARNRKGFGYFFVPARTSEKSIKILDKITKYLKGNISKIINRIENIIDNANILINKTKAIKTNRNIEINYKNFLLKEIGRLKKNSEWHRKINLYLLYFYLMFIAYRIYKYYKNEIKNKHIIEEENF